MLRLSGFLLVAICVGNALLIEANLLGMYNLLPDKIAGMAAMSALCGLAGLLILSVTSDDF